jgi:proliferating cell nuclear antigen
MKFQIKSEDKAVELIEVLKIIKHLTNSATFMCTKEHIFIQIMDQSHVCLLNIYFPAEWFYLYEAENSTFSINTNVLVKVFGMYTMHSVIEVFIENEDKININLIHELQQKRFEIPLMDIEQDVLKPTIKDTNLDFVIKTRTLDKYINELSAFGDDVEIECSDDKLFLTASNHEGSLKIEIKNETLEEFNVIENYTFKNKFCIKYLQYITKLFIIYPTIHLFLDEDNPLMITFKDTDTKFNYYVAPKCSDDSE